MAGEAAGNELGQQVLQAVRDLSTQVSHLSTQVSQLNTQVNQLNTRMDRLETRMDKVEGWMERLGAEFITSREGLKTEIQLVRTEFKSEIQQVRTEMRDGFREVNSRIDRANDSVVMLNSAVHKVTTERIPQLEQRVWVLETRNPQP